MHAPNIVRIIIGVLLANRAALVAENLALRQQLPVLSRSTKRPRLRQRDRIFWVWIASLARKRNILRTSGSDLNRQNSNNLASAAFELT